METKIISIDSRPYGSIVTLQYRNPSPGIIPELMHALRHELPVSITVHHIERIEPGQDLISN